MRKVHTKSGKEQGKDASKNSTKVIVKNVCNRSSKERGKSMLEKYPLTGKKAGKKVVKDYGVKYEKGSNKERKYVKKQYASKVTRN